MKSATTIARMPNSHVKFCMTQASAVLPVVDSDSGEARPQTTTAAVRAPARASTVRLTRNSRPVLSTPIPGISAGWTGSSRAIVRIVRRTLVAGPALVRSSWSASGRSDRGSSADSGLFRD